VIEPAREASLPEFEAMAIASHAWVSRLTGEQNQAATDAPAAVHMWEEEPFRYPFHSMALWPLLARVLASRRIGAAVEHARAMLAPPVDAVAGAGQDHD